MREVGYLKRSAAFEDDGPVQRLCGILRLRKFGHLDSASARARLIGRVAVVNVDLRTKDSAIWRAEVMEQCHVSMLWQVADE